MLGKYLIYRHGKKKAEKKHAAELDDLLYEFDKLKKQLNDLESQDSNDETWKSYRDSW